MKMSNHALYNGNEASSEYSEIVREMLNTACAKFSFNMKRKLDGEDIDGFLLFYEAFRLGQAFQQLRNFEVSLRYYRQALRLKNKTIGREPLETKILFSDILFNVGTIHLENHHDSCLGREKCLEAFNLCLDFRLACYGPSDISVAAVLHKLGLLYFSMEEYSHALDFLLECLSIYLKGGSEYDKLLELWMDIGKVHQALGHYEDAKSSFQEAELVKTTRASVNEH